MTAPLPPIIIVKKKKDAALSRANAFHGLLAGTPTGCFNELHVIEEEIHNPTTWPSDT